ncbi:MULTISPECIES: pirin family protein [Burkholderia cepacia complex]|uniref:Pirin domain protein n=1 Tax=Burkholderia orbicola (strain MC0-3) TaxID=406425 RepID=B1JWD1_BURO0|nr:MULTISPECIES: pirin family protein [Burkholderia cepacia complex]ACA91568.1 Pirin domain protein [Burkholderia orbicola MC0-3]MDS0850008.1 pirin family protein [Burkholderia cenocepacia]
MFQILRAEDRCRTHHGWLESSHSFSSVCRDGHAPVRPPVGALCVLSEDRIAPTRGFGMQPRRDVEILTYVLDGELAHRDSLGCGAIVRTGGIQRMSAGTGLVHSETNASRDRPLHLLQIWLQPAERGGRPGYEARRFADDEKRGRLRLVAAPDGGDGALSVRADARIFAGLIDGDETAAFDVPAGRSIYVHVVRGEVEVNGRALAAGDGARIGGVDAVAFARGRTAEVLLFDVA